MQWDARLAVTFLWTIFGTCCYLLAPGTAPFLLPLTVLAPMFWYPHNGIARLLWSRSLVAQIFAITSAYLAIRASWSTAPTSAYMTVATLLVVSAVVHIVTCIVPLLERAPVRAMSSGFYVGYVFCGFLICIEIVFQYPLHIYLFSIYPMLAPQNNSEIVFASGLVKSLPSYFLNRNIAAIAFLIWPALLVATSLSSSIRTRTLLFLGLTPAVIAIFLSAHATSKMAALGGVAVFFLTMVGPRLAKPLLSTAWILAFISVVPLSWLAFHQYDLHKADWLPPSARHRIVYWGVSAAKIGESPVFGHGIASGRELDLQARGQPEYVEGTSFVRSPGPHSHDAYLQIWFDVGVIGALLISLLGLSALASIGHVEPNLRPALYAVFATNALLAASSFGIWASWFLASFGLSTVFASLAWKFGQLAEDLHPDQLAAGTPHDDGLERARDRSYGA